MAKMAISGSVRGWNVLAMLVWEYVRPLKSGVRLFNCTLSGPWAKQEVLVRVLTVAAFPLRALVGGGKVGTVADFSAKEIVKRGYSLWSCAPIATVVNGLCVVRDTDYPNGLVIRGGRGGGVRGEGRRGGWVRRWDVAWRLAVGVEGGREGEGRREDGGRKGGRRKKGRGE